MGKHAQLVMGPAGSGKSTYCSLLAQHCASVKRVIHIVNLDPAADYFAYKAEIDIRDLISVDDAMEELELGPNGALVFCMEYLVDNLSWLEEQVADFEDDYLVFDLPGQIELYSHLPIMKKFVAALERWGYRACSVHLVDHLCVHDASRFVATTLMCLSAMMRLELPHVNLLTKCDLMKDKKKLDEFLDPQYDVLLSKLDAETSPSFRLLNSAISDVLENYNLVSFMPIDGNDMASIEAALSHIDYAIQYGEDLEPKDPDEVDEERELAAIAE